MPDPFLTFLMILLLALLASGALFAWSRRSHAPRLAILLRLSAGLWAIWLTLCFAAYTFVTLQCGGNWLYGFVDCSATSDDLANTLAATSILSFAAAIAYGAVLVIGGGIAEAVARNRQPPSHP